MRPMGVGARYHHVGGTPTFLTSTTGERFIPHGEKAMNFIWGRRFGGIPDQSCLTVLSCLRGACVHRDMDQRQKAQTHGRGALPVGHRPRNKAGDHTLPTATCPLPKAPPLG